MDRRGFTIIEITLAMALLGVTLMIFMIPQLEFQKNMKRADSKISRTLENQYLLKKLEEANTSLEKSARKTENSDLCPCLIGGNMKESGINICNKNICTPGTNFNFVLYDGDKKSPLPKLTGTDASPMFYDANGNPCTPDTTKNITCSYQVKTQFNATCADGLSLCDHAEFITIQISFVPVDTSLVAAAAKTVLFPTNVNYKPFLNTIPNQIVTMPLDTQIAVYANAGDASENQNFIFEQCTSSAPTVLEVHCYKFVNSVGQIILKPKSSGNATIKLQINDGGDKNNLSDPMTFTATVN